MNIDARYINTFQELEAFVTEVDRKINSANMSGIDPSHQARFNAEMQSIKNDILNETKRQDQVRKAISQKLVTLATEINNAPKNVAA